MKEHHGAKDVARKAPRHDDKVEQLHMQRRPRVETRDMGHTVHTEELMNGLKMGQTHELDDATDNAVVESRTLYKDWADSEQRRLKSQYDEVYGAIVAELARRELPY